MPGRGSLSLTDKVDTLRASERELLAEIDRLEAGGAVHPAQGTARRATRSATTRASSPSSGGTGARRRGSPTSSDGSARHGGAVRIVVFAAGAIGSLLGASLAHAGHDVLLVARADHAAAIRESGLRITGSLVETVALRAETAVPPDFEPEGVLLTAKTFDLPASAGLLAIEVPSPVPTLLPQNGLGVEDPVRASLAAGGWPDTDRWVVRAVNTIPATFLGPGEVRAAGNGEIVLGRARGPSATASRTLVRLFHGTDVPVRIVDDLEREVWRKALLNAAVNPVTALHGVPNGRLLEEPYRTEPIALLEEALATARACGFDFKEKEVARGPRPGPAGDGGEPVQHAPGPRPGPPHRDRGDLRGDPAARQRRTELDLPFDPEGRRCDPGPFARGRLCPGTTVIGPGTSRDRSPWRSGGCNRPRSAADGSSCGSTSTSLRSRTARSPTTGGSSRPSRPSTTSGPRAHEPSSCPTSAARRASGTPGSVSDRSPTVSARSSASRSPSPVTWSVSRRSSSPPASRTASSSCSRTCASTPARRRTTRSFAAQLARLGELFVEDAFGTVHRAHASTVGVPKRLPVLRGTPRRDARSASFSRLRRVAGPPVRRGRRRREGRATSSRCSTSFLGRADTTADRGRAREPVPGAAGALARCQPPSKRASRSAVDRVPPGCAEAAHTEVLLPTDVVVDRPGPHRGRASTRSTEVPAGRVRPGYRARDARPVLRRRSPARRPSSGTGPSGAPRTPASRTGTREVLGALGSIAGYHVAAGGDSARIAQDLGVTGGFQFISTGGGAALEFVQGLELPGLAVLPDA